MDEDLLALRCEALADVIALDPPVLGGLHEVRDDGDLLVDSVVRGGLLPQEAGDGGHPVALLDAELHHGQEPGLEADQRDVGAMERGDDREVPVEYLLGQEGAHGVRDRIVGVEDVELFVAGYLHDLARKGRRVQREFKEGIPGHLHFMVEDVAQEPVQPHGHGITDEMNLMSARCKCLAKLCRHHSAAAVGRVAHNADFHEVVLHSGKIQKPEYSCK